MKPILFNTEMVKAIMEGRKTCTRRLVKQSTLQAVRRWQKERPKDKPEELIDKLAAPPYYPGDVLYVRETWTTLHYVDANGRTHYDRKMYFYAADGEPDVTLYDADGFEQDDQRIRWRPSIHMPKEAARIFLRVKNVHAERLQDIDGAGQRAEGADSKHGFGATRGAFIDLWNSTIKPAERICYGWDANPWVWVIEFERIEEGEAK